MLNQINVENRETKDDIETYRDIGQDDKFWQMIRFSYSLRGNERKEFVTNLSNPESKLCKYLDVNDEYRKKLASYISFRDSQFTKALNLLRTETQSREACKKRGISWKLTKVRNKTHHQSSKTMISIVNDIAEKVCNRYSKTVNIDPRSRCTWKKKEHLHVTARNLDGAIPGLDNPFLIWEIKEYWGKSKGGSKMSDAVYECELVGRDIKEYQEKTNTKIYHVVFLDGKDQWEKRKSDLYRFFDLKKQGAYRLFNYWQGG